MQKVMIWKKVRVPCRIMPEADTKNLAEGMLLKPPKRQAFKQKILYRDDGSDYV